MAENKNVEYLSTQEWQQWQTELLQSTLNNVYRRVPFYQHAFKKSAIEPSDIHSLDDLQRLPFTTRKDLSENYPYGLFARPLRDIVRIHTLRGSLQKPVVIGCTAQDLKHRHELAARLFKACGVDQDDIVQICLDQGLSTLGQELKESAEAVGALVIPPDPVPSPTQARVMMDFRTTVLVTTPSYAKRIVKEIEMGGLPLSALTLKIGIFVGERLSEEDKAFFREFMSINSYSSYGILEVSGPALAYECEMQEGLHIAMDHFIAEIVDPDTGQPLPQGEEGELVITTLTARANPLIRFRTGDLTHIMESPCKCGRTTMKIAPINGRCDNIISIRGIKIDPSEIGELIKICVPGEVPPYILVVHTENFLEKPEIWLAMNEQLFSGSLPQLHHLISRLEDAFEQKTGLSCKVRPREYRTIKPYLKKGEMVVWT